MVFSLHAQTTFTATLGANGNWSTASWVQSGSVISATYPGQTGYSGELAGDIHNVVINTSGATSRTLALDASILSHVGSVTINNAPGVAVLAVGNNSLTISGNLAGAGTLTFGSGTLALAGDFLHTGTFTVGTGTVLFNGVNQVVRATTYNNLSISGSGVKAVGNANLVVSGNLDVSGSTLAITAITARTTTVNGNLSGNGTIDLSGGNLTHILDLKGAANSIGTLTTSATGLSVVSYTGTNQTVFGSANYRSVTFTGNTKTLQGDISHSGVFTLSAATVLSLNGKNLALNGTTSIGNLATSTIGGDVNSVISIASNNTAALTLPLISGSIKSLTVNKTGTTPTVSTTGLLTLVSSLDLLAGTLSTGTNNTVVGSDLNLASGATYTTSTGSTSVTGNITGSGALTYTGAGTLNISGDFSIHTGTFTCGTGLVNYGGGNQIIRDVLYYDLTASGTGTKTYTATKNIGRNLVVSAGAILDYGTTSVAHSVAGTATINGTLNIGTTPTFTVSGATAIGGVVNFGGVLNTVTLGALSGAGTLNMTGVGLAHTLNLNGATNSIANFNTTDGSGSTVIYLPNLNQEVFSSLNYQNLTTTGGAIKTLKGNTTVKGNLNAIATFNLGTTPNTFIVNGNVTFNNSIQFGTTSATSMIVYGNLSGPSLTMTGVGLAHSLSLYGATNTLTSGFLTTTNGSGSTINYLANSNQTVFASTAYQNLNMGGSGIKTLAAGAVTVSGNMDISNSTLLFPSSSATTFTLNGDLSGNGILDMSSGAIAHVINLNGANNSISSLLTSSTSTQNYGRAGNQQILASSNYKTVNISGSGIKSFQGASNVAGITTLSGTATLDLNGQSVGCDGSITLGVGTTLAINSNATLSIANGKTITSAGKISLVGTAGNLATITRKGAVGGYSIIQNNAAAEFNANNYLMDYLSGGLTISAGTINATNNFSNGTFSNGVGTEYLKISTTTDLSAIPVVVNTTFGVGPTYNVTRTNGTGKLIFEQSSGVLAGENFDNDNGNPGTLLDWTFPGNVFYSKGNLPAGLTTSWSKNPDGSGANPSSLSDGLNTLIIQDGHTITLDNNGDLKVLALQVGQGSSGKLVIGQNSSIRTLTIQNDLTVKAGGIVSVGAGSNHNIIILSGDIVNDGTFDLWGTGAAYANVQVLGNMGIKGSVAPIFANLNMAANSIVSLSVDLNVAQNLSMLVGSKFNDGGKIISVGANWNNQTGVATNVTCTGTAVFNGLVSTISSGTSTTFNNLTFNGSNGFFSETTIVNGDFLATNNVAVYTDAAKTVTFNNKFQVDATATFAASGTVNMSSTNVQPIVLNGITSFASLSFSNGGVNAKSITGDFTATANVVLNSGSTVDGSGTYTISGNLTLNGSCNWSGKVIQKGGTILTTNAGGAMALGTAELFIDGNVWLGFGAPAISSALTVNENVTVNTGYLVVNTGTQLIGQPSNILKVTTLLYSRGANNFPTGFGTFDLALGSTIIYDQNINQTVRGGLSYGNLTIASSSPSTVASSKTVDGALDVNGNFSLGASTTLDLGAYVHTFAGNVALNGTATINGTNATIELNALDANQTVSGGIYNIKNISIDQAGATVSRTKTISTGTTINMNGNFVVANSSGAPSIILTVDLGSNGISGLAGLLTLGAYTQLNTALADFYTGVLNNFLGGIAFDINSTVNYNLGGNQTIADGVTYGNLALSGSGTKTARGALNIDGDFSSSGAGVTFDDASGIHTVAGNWALNAGSYGLGSANGTIVLDGVNQTIGGQTFNDLSVANSGLADVNNNLTVLGNLLVSTTGKIDFSVRNLDVKGDVNINGSGLLTQTTGTTSFTGTVNQNLTSNSSSSFGNLTINKPNPKGSQTLKVNTVLNVVGNTRIVVDAGVLDISNQTVNFGGHFQLDDNIIETTSSFITSGSTVRFNGAVSQYVRTLSHLPFTFNNIYFGGSGNKIFGCLFNGRTPNVLANDSLVVNGNFDIDGANVNNSSGVLNAGSNVFLFGNWTNSGTFTHPGSRTVYFVGGNQTISGSDFYNIDVQGTGVKTLTGPIQVANSLKLTSASFDCSNYGIYVGGNWDNRGSAIFIPQTGKVSFVGANGSNIYTGTTTGVLAGKSFYDLDINKIGGGVALQGDLDLINDFTILANTFTTNSFDMWLGGNFDNQGGVFSHNNNSSILTLKASGGQKIFRPTNPSALLPTDMLGIVVNAPGAKYLVSSNFNINNVDFNLMAGDFILNKNTMKVNNNSRKILVNGGKFHVDSASVVDFTNTGGGITLNNGELRIVGSSSKTSKLWSSAGSFIVSQTGGILHVTNYDIQNGIFTISGGSIDAVDNFSNGSFTGYTAGGLTTAYINLDGQNCGDIAFNNIVFNAGSVSPKYNIYRSAGTGVISCLDAMGSFAGQTYEKDNGAPGTLINWTYPAGFFWNAGAGVDQSWDNPLNWASNVVPGVNDIAYINHKYVPAATAYKVRVNSTSATAKRLILDAQGGAGGIEVIIEAGKQLTLAEDVQIGTNTILSQAAASSQLALGTNWSNSGTYNHNGATVTFKGAGGSNNISSGGIGAGKAFYSIVINAPITTYSLTNATKFDGNVTISNGTLDLASAVNDILVAGNWFVDQANGGVFSASGADVTFNGSNQTIANGLFYNLLTANSGIKTISSNIKVSNNLTIAAGTTLSSGANDLYVSGSWVNNGTYSQTGIGTVIFDGTGSQSIDNGGLGTTFNNVTFSNGGTKTFFKNEVANGNVLINAGSGTVNLDIYTLSGVGAANSLTSNGTLQIRGVNNFPIGFESINMASSSLVHYYSNLGQTVYATSYGNIRLGRITAGTPSTKTAAGNLDIVGGLYIDQDGETTLDMATNDASMTLTGSASIATGSKVTWGTVNSTLTHIGGNWRIDKDLTSFNNLVLGGNVNSPNITWMEGDFTMTGDLRVKSGNDLRMVYDDNRIANQFHKITGNGTHSVIIESGGRILNTRPATDGIAIPENFATYSFDPSSTYYFWSQNGIDQTIYTGNGVQYGSIYNGNVKTLTLDGVADWKVKGTLNFAGGSAAQLVDAGKNIEAGGADVLLTGYMPSSNNITFTLNGMGNQYLRDDVDNTINLAKVVFAGGGTKTIGDGNDAIVVSGDWVINSNIIATSGRNIAFGGLNWINNGTFTHSGGTVTFNGLSNQSINAGMPSATNYFNAVTFSNPSIKTFISKGADINSTFTITDGTVDMGNLLFHNIGGNIVNTTGGIMLAGSSNITLDGGNQNVQSPAFTVGNITISGTGTKRLFGDWTINGNLLINSGTTLNTSDNGAPAAISNVFVGGHWINNGTFAGNTSTVTFNSVNTSTDILAGTGNFYDVVFGANTSVYRLLSPLTRFSRSMTLGSNAELSLNQNTLVLGSNIVSGKVFNVNGKLTVNQNAYLKFNNVSSQCVMNVSGTLNIVGSSSNAIATITRETAGVAGAESQINILPSGTLAARYYLVEYLQDAGMNCQAGSILDAVNNMSDGTWSNVRTNAGAKYLTLESSYSGGVISNINFNYTGTPTSGTNFSVQRKLAATPVIFDLVGGSLGSYKFENDDEAIAAASTGLLRWPAVTQTNWTGALDTDWDNAGNWDNGVPSSTIDALISDKPNDPTISNSNASCKKLELSNGILTLSNAKSLTVTGDLNIGIGTLSGKLLVTSSASQINVGGSWNRGTNGFFSHGNGTVLFNSSGGAVNINPVTSHFYNVVFSGVNTDFFLNGVSDYFDGGVDIENGNLVPTSNNYSHTIKGDFYIKTGAQFTASGGSVGVGTITLSGANQTITNGTFSNLIVSGTGNKTFVYATLINGTTTVSSNMVASVGAPIEFVGNVVFNAGSSFNDGGETHLCRSVQFTGPQTYSGNGTIVFNPTASLSLLGGVLHNLEVATSKSVNVYANTTVQNNLVLNISSIVNLNSYTLNNSSGTGVFTMMNNSGIAVGGANNFPKNYATYSLAVSSSVNYNGGANQSIDGVSYGNLILSNANTKTLAGNAIVKGNLSFNTATFDVSVNNYLLNVAGQWNNGGTGTFVARQGTVSFDGSANQNITVGASNSNDFYNLNISNSGSAGNNSVFANWPTTNLRQILNNLTVVSGQYSANGRAQTVGGDLLASGTGLFVAGGDYTLNKASGSASIASNGSSFGKLTFNGAATYTAVGDVIVSGNFTQNSGQFNGNGKSISLGSNANVVTLNGIYKVGSNGKMVIGGATSVVVGASGRFELVGAPAGIAMVTYNPIYVGNGRYTFMVNGIIAARYYTFEYMGTGGINLASSSTIDATNNLSDGTFNNGVANQPMLQVQNSQSFVSPNYIANVTFPSNPGGTANNVKKSNGAGTIEFYNATGLFAGSAFESDPANLVNWTGPLKLTWNGSVSTDWNMAANWTASFGPSFVPTGAEDVIIATAVNQPVLTTFGQKTANLTINNGAKIILNTPNDGALIDLDVKGDMNLIGSILPQSSDDYINVTGSWVKTGTGSAVLGTVSFSGTGSSKYINNGSGANCPFNYLTIGGATLYQLAVNTTVNNDLNILSGASFGTGSYTLIVDGNWNNAGTFFPSNGVVRLKASSGNKVINNGTSLFNSLEVNALGATYKLMSNVSVNGNLDNTNGTIDLNGFTVKVGDNVGSDFFNIYGTVIANGTSKINMIGTAGTPAKLTVFSGGGLQIVGVDANNRSTVYSSTGGRYDFSISSGAKLDAKYYSVANTTAAGLSIASGAIVSSTNNLSQGMFSNGLGGYTYLSLYHEMAANDTIRGLVFNAGASYNVSRTTGTTIYSFVDAGGAMGGYAFENDLGGIPDASNGYLRWESQQLYTWLGLTDDWSSATNWYNGVLPNNLANVTINAGTPFTPTIKSATNVSINDLKIVAGAKLTVANGAKLTVNGNVANLGSFVVQNQPNAMASVITNGSFTGNAQIETALPANRYYYMGNSVSNLSSGIYNAADLVNTKAYKYPAGWLRYTDNVTPLESSPLVGYCVKFAGANTITAVGPLNSSDYSLSMPANVWTLVANPYNCTLDMNLNYVASVANWLPSGNLDPTYYVPTNSGPALVFSTYNQSTGLSQNGGSNKIAPLQAFWVRNKKATSGTFTVYKSSRIHDTSVMLKSLSSADDDDVLRLSVANKYSTDEAVFAFRSQGSVDLAYTDSEKKMSTDALVANIYSIKSLKAIAINCMPVLEHETSIPLGYTVGATGAGDVIIKATNINGFMPSVDVWLEDVATGQSYNLREINEVSVKVEAGSNTTRFILHFLPSEIGTPTIIVTNKDVNADNIVISSAAGKATIDINTETSIDATVELFNPEGQLITSLKTHVKHNELTLPAYSQVYIIRVVNQNQYKTVKIVAK